MTPVIPLSALFIALVLASALSLWLCADRFGRFKAVQTQKIDRFFSSELVALNAAQCFYIYVTLIVFILVALLSIGLPVIVVIFAFVFFLSGPSLAFRYLEARRRVQMVRALPDTLQQISGALRAGATFNTALEALVDEQSGPIAQEFSLVLREQRMGIPMDESLENLGDRINSEEFDVVISAIKIAQDVGGNLAEVFSRLADTLRSKITMEERIRSLTAQGVMQGYVVTALPAMIVVALTLLETKAMLPLFTTVLGWGCLLLITCLLMTGGWFIRKVVRIDI